MCINKEMSLKQQKGKNINSHCYEPVVIDGIRGAGVFSVLCFGLIVVNGALILITAGRSKRCNRTLPLILERVNIIKGTHCN
jgi:hypothetical protein